jgi:hypothetical protein
MTRRRDKHLSLRRRRRPSGKLDYADSVRTVLLAN